VKYNKDGTVKDDSLNAACGGNFCDYRIAMMGFFLFLWTDTDFEPELFPIMNECY